MGPAREPPGTGCRGARRRSVASRAVTPDPSELRSVVEHLAAMDRPSASPGERAAAEWIAGALRERGCRVELESEAAHGGYWWPLGLLGGLAAAGGLAGLRGRRAAAILAGGFASSAMADDLRSGKLWFRRRFLPRRSTTNVVGVAGDPDAGHTLILTAHYDAPHTGIVFHPAPQRAFGERFPTLLERSNTSIPVMWPVFAGPLLVLFGALAGSRRALRAGAALGAATAAAMADIGNRGTVPGANDNLSAVSALLAVARTVHERPVRGLRLLFVATGSEESLQEGMLAFAARHFGEMDPAETSFLNLESVGSPQLAILEGEGMLTMRDYPQAFRDIVAAAADERGIHLQRGLRNASATDGLIPLKHGYPCASLVSVTWWKAISNYHWPTDVPENVNFETVAQAVEVAEAVVRRMADAGAPDGDGARPSAA